MKYANFLDDESLFHILPRREFLSRRARPKLTPPPLRTGKREAARRLKRMKKGAAQ